MHFAYTAARARKIGRWLGQQYLLKLNIFRIMIAEGSSIYMSASYEELRKSDKKWEQLGKRASYENI